MPKTSCRSPAERASGMFGRTYIHSAIDQYVEAQSATRSKLERADSALHSIVEYHAADAAQRRQIAGQSCQARSIQFASVYAHGGVSRETRCRGTAGCTDPGARQRFLAVEASARHRLPEPGR